MRTTRWWRSNSGGRTCRLAIFRVHSVAKPQLTALLGSYSFSRILPPSSCSPSLPVSVLIPLFLLVCPPSLLQQCVHQADRFSSRPAATYLFLSCINCRFSLFSFPSSLYHTHVFFLSLAPSPLNSFVFFCSTRFFGISNRAFVSPSRLFFACVCYEEFPFAQPRISELNNDIYNSRKEIF